MDDRERGLTSNTFNLEGNIEDSDESRHGLSDDAASFCERSMREEGLTFDEARLELLQQQITAFEQRDGGRLTTFIDMQSPPSSKVLVRKETRDDACCDGCRQQ